MERKYKIPIPDRELACAPFESPEGRDYFAAMQGAVNMSFANRQVILHRIREVFSAAFGRSAEELGMHMVYDVAHNTAKLERHVVEGEVKTLLMHRKGATRAFGPGMEGLPDRRSTALLVVKVGGHGDHRLRDRFTEEGFGVALDFLQEERRKLFRRELTVAQPNDLPSAHFALECRGRALGIGCRLATRGLADQDLSVRGHGDIAGKRLTAEAHPLGAWNDHRPSAAQYRRSRV
jgi:hypothetical protein